MGPKELLATIDAVVWAREFCRIVGEKVPAIRDEQEWMVGWFANAMMAEEIAGRRDAEKEFANRSNAEEPR